MTFARATEEVKQGKRITRMGQNVCSGLLIVLYSLYFKAQRAERTRNMNKSELVNAVAANGLTKKDAEAAINAVFGAIEDALAKGEAVQLIGFGTFSVKERAAREGRNPRTGETVKIKASKIPTFKAGKALKDKVK
jgi:DNA-binding protein HU-beta